MSMQTISSPRLASSGTRRRPIKPVPPRIRIDMGSSPVKCAQGSLVPREGFRQRRVGQSPLQRGAVPVREIGGSLVGALQKVEKRGGGVGRLAHRLIRQDEFADFLAVIRASRLDLCIGEAGRLRIGIGIEGGLAKAAIAGPKARA